MEIVTETRCGASMDAEDRFCEQCGAKAASTAGRLCRRCGGALGSAARYCPHCGARAVSPVAGIPFHTWVDRARALVPIVRNSRAARVAPPVVGLLLALAAGYGLGRWSANTGPGERTIAAAPAGGEASEPRATRPVRFRDFTITEKPSEVDGEGSPSLQGWGGIRPSRA